MNGLYTNHLRSSRIRTMDDTATRRLSLTLTLLVAALLLPLTAIGISPPLTDQNRFLEAEKALKKNEAGRYQKLKSQLIDYPLYPYLEFQELTQQRSKLKSRSVEQFLTRYKETPLAPRMRRIWLSELAKRKQWWIYLTFYRPGIGTKFDCHRMLALLGTGHADEAFSEIPQLWLSGKSQPKACDPVFDHWRKAGKLTAKLAWKRAELAMNEGETTLARYLKRYLPMPEREQLELWLKLHKRPKTITDKRAFRQASSHREKILLHGFKRLARQDHLGALTLWPRLRASYPFSKEQLYQGERELLLSLARNGHPAILPLLDGFTPKASDGRFLTTRIRTALSMQEWPFVLTWIEALPEKLQQSERWRYWRARATEAVGRQEEAMTLFRALSLERSYYGFLAADKTGVRYRFDPIPLSLDQKELDRTAQLPTIRRAHELFSLGRFLDARREWNLAVKGMPPEKLQLVSKLAQGWGWHDRAIFTLARTGYWDDLELRFPLKHKDKVSAEAVNRQLDNAWVFAVIRQESAFSQDAHSPAGALGLMQLMPNTARFIAKKTKQRRPRKQELLNPDTNITLGTAYLSRVYKQLGKNQVLATAAYNAGPHRVRAWLPETTIAADLWVETIPFRETRSYTQRVLSYAVIYDQRLGKKATPLSLRMPWVFPESHIMQIASASPAKSGVDKH
ncbi:MAG: transglycosylase SLT domain-containing protein [Candidatus Sedimenticola sp. (ex Thyasira tokunagai)]